MKKASTPGPWAVDSDGDLPDRKFRVSKLFYVVADVGSQADANLIAAAPDLLDTLQSFEDAFGEAVDTDADINGADAVEFICGYLIEVRAALAKARGGVK